MSIIKLMRIVTVLVVLSLASMSLVLVVLAPIVRNDKVYLAASIDKEKRLKTVVAPRIIFVGGSNLALGLNSKKIEAITGLNVVNMGLHAGLGMPFPLNEAQDGLKKDDIVILSIEYFLPRQTNKLVAQLVDVNPKTYNYFAFLPFETIRIYTQEVQRCLSSLFYELLHIDHLDYIYNRQGFTVQGDLITHFGKPKPVKLSDDVTFVDSDYSEGIKVINRFITSARQKGSIVFFTYPAYPSTSFERNKEVLTNLTSQYNSRLNCPILGTIKTFVLPDKYFFDTVYHLDSIGVQKRTDIMISLLQSRNIIVNDN